MKQKRTKDKDYVRKIKKIPCVACGKHGVDAHHIKSRGSGGGDDFYNLIPLCPDHHTMSGEAWHRLGSVTFLNKFPHVMELIANWGWKIEGKKLIREENENVTANKSFQSDEGSRVVVSNGA